MAEKINGVEFDITANMDGAITSFSATEAKAEELQRALGGVGKAADKAGKDTTKGAKKGASGLKKHAWCSRTAWLPSPRYGCTASIWH